MKSSLRTLVRRLIENELDRSEVLTESGATIQDLIASAQEETALLPKVSYMSDLPPTEEISERIRKIESAMNAWGWVINKLETSDDPDSKKLIDNAWKTQDRIEEMLVDAKNDLEDALERDDRKAKFDANLQAAGLKALTLNDVKNIYVGAKSSYGSSGAMLVDDAIEGAERPARKAGIGVYYDGGVFPRMIGFIKNHVPWQRIPDSVKAEMLELANEELGDIARRKLSKSSR
jgi:hypothetical protein